jgi:putative transposase
MRQQPLVSVQAYNLLPNHFHILLTQIADGGISEFIKRVASGYTLYFNERYKRSGVLFQGTFKRVHVESSAQVQYLLAYINENRFVHGLPDDAEKITSSSEHYQGKRKDKLITELLLDSAYSIQQARLLAKDIYRRRKGERLATFD